MRDAACLTCAGYDLVTLRVTALDLELAKSALPE